MATLPRACMSDISTKFFGEQVNPQQNKGSLIGAVEGMQPAGLCYMEIIR